MMSPDQPVFISSAWTANNMYIIIVNLGIKSMQNDLVQETELKSPSNMAIWVVKFLREIYKITIKLRTVANPV